MLVHGYAPDRLNLNFMVPIPKSKRKSLDDSNNYRAISLNSILGKLFDNILLDFLQNDLNNSDYQFAYKKGVSTNMCTFLVSQTIEYYRTNNTPVYAVFLDATKAFDRIEYEKLFSELLQYGICPVVIRLLINMYSQNKACIKWNGVKSDNFPVLNGVKQGGVLSPQLFCFYMNPLIRRLHSSGYGCYVGNIPSCVFSYADDVLLLAPTKTAIQNLLNICSDFSKEYMIKFNPDKCSVMVFNNVKDVAHPQIVLNDKELKYVINEKYLGHWIKNSKDIIDPINGINDIGIRANVLLRNFYYLDMDSKVKLFNSCCLSLYGCELWDLASKEMTKAAKIWRIWGRRILGVSDRTHNVLMPGLLKTPSIDEIIETRILCFLSQGLQHANTFVKNMFINCVLHGNYMSRNFSYLLHKYRLSLSESLISKSRLKTHVKRYYKEVPHTCVVVKELLHCKDNMLDCGLDSSETDELLFFLCTS